MTAAVHLMSRWVFALLLKSHRAEVTKSKY